MSTFRGEQSLQSIVIRSWSALVGLIGIVLIIGYLIEDPRKYSLVIAAVSKSIFVILILTYGQTFLGNVWPAITMDIVVVTAAVAYFILR
ncbi:hypothetical protein KO489_12600 [Reinekea forsetii]|nr:hypothetical protein [Reinekea forsetii]